MEPWKTSALHDILANAMRSNDALTIMRLVTEQIETTEGAEKAYWLRYRAMAKRHYGHALNQASVEADLTEANLTDPDFTANVKYILNQAVVQQRLSLLAQIDCRLRPAIRKELCGDWRYWAQVGHLHRLRRRFPQSYRAFSMELRLFLNISPEEMRNNRGWTIAVSSVHARAALRVGKLDEAVISLERATAVDREMDRKHVNPIYLAIAQAEVSFAMGQYAEAIHALQMGRSRAAAKDFRPMPPDQIDTALIAAKVARAEGNMAGFQHFCQQAMDLAMDNNLPLTATEVQAVMDGALW
jgi:tetratricopeptide (TPR) repeat protein